MILSFKDFPHLHNVIQYNCNYKLLISLKATCVAGVQAYDCERHRLWIRLKVEEMKYLIYSYARSDNEAKLCLCVFRNRRKVEKGLNESGVF